MYHDQIFMSSNLFISLILFNILPRRGCDTATQIFNIVTILTILFILETS